MMFIQKFKGTRLLAGCLALAMSLAFLPVTGLAGEAGTKVVSLANDNTPSQREEILNHFNVSEEDPDVQFITTTIEEEYEYLGDVAGPEIIGTRTMSSAFLEILPEGEGISVETHNITWVTKEMYASALVTAGVNDASISAASPVPVSGTGALTGVIKAFEAATGETLSEENKKAAHEELVILQELTEEDEDDERINRLIQEAKEEILNRRPLDADEIEEIIRRLADELNVELTEQQITRITNFLIQFNHIDVDLDQLRDQIERLAENPAVRTFFSRVIDQVISWLQEILDMLRDRDG